MTILLYILYSLDVVLVRVLFRKVKVCKSESEIRGDRNESITRVVFSERSHSLLPLQCNTTPFSSFLGDHLLRQTLRLRRTIYKRWRFNSHVSFSICLSWQKYYTSLHTIHFEWLDFAVNYVLPHIPPSHLSLQIDLLRNEYADIHSYSSDTNSQGL